LFCILLPGAIESPRRHPAGDGLGLKLRPLSYKVELNPLQAKPETQKIGLKYFHYLQMIEYLIFPAGGL
jgi:hypothetical protein